MRAYICGFIAIILLLTCSELQAGQKLTQEQFLKFKEASLAARQNKFSVAVDIYEAMAELDLVDAQYNLAFLLDAGLGRPQDYKAAIYWAWLAQVGGEVRAQDLAKQLSSLLSEDVAMEVIASLVDRLTKQIENGKTESILKIAMLYLDVMPEPDYANAYIWFSIGQAIGLPAAAAGSAEARSNLEGPMLIEAQASAKALFGKLTYLKTPEGN
ncbi:MAG: TPR repeat protein [Paracoccaceae bacterium]|jgi:TPR repeat protein